MENILRIICKNHRDYKSVLITNRAAVRKAKKYSGESGVDGTVNKQIIALFYYSKICRYCGVITGRKTRSIDHMLPLSKGGKHSIKNIALCCRNCNQRKGNKTLIEFIISEKQTNEYAK
jgi:5-methylcytosine-specific restriction endonuclease McrA